MAEEEHHQKIHEYEGNVNTEGSVESKDRGMFDFLGKKEEEKPQPHQDQEVIIVTEFEKVHVSEPKVEKEEDEEEEKKKPGLLEKLHRSKSSSSSSSDEEGDDEEKKKKKKEKKGLKEKLKEKISGQKEEEEKHEDTTVRIEEVHEVPHHQEHAHPEEKKGFLDRIKEKLPGQNKKHEDQSPHPPAAAAAADHAVHASADSHISNEGEAKEKKGIFEKIKEKLPGYHHPKTEEDNEKEKEKESNAY